MLTACECRCSPRPTRSDPDISVSVTDERKTWRPVKNQGLDIWHRSRGTTDFHPEMARVGFDVSDWEPLTVPWASHEERRGGGSSGSSGSSMVIRREFHCPAEADRARRTWLELEGVPGQADVWVDGTLAGEIDCEHAPYLFEVPSNESDHAIALEVTSQRSSAWPEGSADLRGVTEPMRVHTTGNAAFTRLKMLCSEARTEHAAIQINAEVNVARPCSVSIRTRVRKVGSTDPEFSQQIERTVAAGPNRVRWAVSVEKPDFWWPHALGPGTLYDISVDLIDADTGDVSDTRTLRTGLRSMSLERWATTLNGAPMFVKGALLPSRSDTDDDAVELVRNVREAGLDLVYLRDGVQRPAFYEAADELGMMIWQQLPLVGRERSRRRHERLARQVIDRFAHHPGIVAWTREGHLLGAWPPSSDAQRRLIEKADPTRPVLIPPRPFDLTKLRAKNDRFVAISGNAHQIAERVDHVRARKFRPARGLLVWNHPEAAFDALSPIRLIAGNVELDDDDRLAIRVDVVNDTRLAFPRVQVHATLRGSTEQYEWRWEGDITPDSAARIGVMRFPVIDVGTRLEVELEAIDESRATLARSLVVRTA